MQIGQAPYVVNIHNHGPSTRTELKKKLSSENILTDVFFLIKYENI